MQKIENGEIKTHTPWLTEDITWETFSRENLAGRWGSSTPLIWIENGCEYKEVWFMALGLLQLTNPLSVLYLLPLSYMEEMH